MCPQSIRYRVLCNLTIMCMQNAQFLRSHHYFCFFTGVSLFLLFSILSEMKFTCSTIDQLSGVLERVCQCDMLTCWQSVLPHLYSILLVVFRTFRGGGGQSQQVQGREKEHMGERYYNASLCILAFSVPNCDYIAYQIIMHVTYINFIRLY